MLALQRSAGNLHVAQALGRVPRPVLARALDTDFEHAGKPTEAEQKTCDAFGAIVSGFVDQAHLALLGGHVKGWKGAKITAFLKLLTKGHRAAVVHAGNVIEERVYALMLAATLPAEWKAQFSEGMGSASKPDIVIHLGDGREGLIDITSQRGHILGKAGAWTTSKKYVYVAEAWFPSVFADHLPHIRKAIEAGGLGEKELAEMQAEVAEQRKNRAKQREAELKEAREIYRSYSSFSAFVEEAFEGSRTEAAKWMRERGMGGYKGVPKRKGRRKISEAARKQRKKKAAEARKLKAKPESPMSLEGRIATGTETQRSQRQDIIQSKRASALKQAPETTGTQAEEGTVAPEVVAPVTAETEVDTGTAEPEAEAEVTMDDTSMDAEEYEEDEGDEDGGEQGAEEETETAVTPDPEALMTS